MLRLPLTLFEQVLFHSDRPAYPCWLVTKFRFRGRIEREAFQRAVQKAAQRHPLLTAVVRRTGRKRWIWEPSGNPTIAIEWKQQPRDDGWPDWHRLDLTTENGFRLYVVEDASGVDIHVQFHHAVLDGVALLTVFHDIMACYVRERGQEVELPELKPELLPQRNRFSPSVLGLLKMIPAQMLGLFYSVELTRRQVNPLVSHRVTADDSPRPPGYPTLVRHCFSREEFLRLRNAAKAKGVSTNDILIRDFFYAMGAWRKKQQAGSDSDWQRMVIPVSLRRPIDRFMPATNITSVVPLDRQAGGLQNRDRQLQRANEDMTLIKENRLGYTYWITLWFHHLMPGGIRGMCRRDRCLSTVVLTNVGQMFSRSPLLNKERKLAVEGAVLEDICMAAPYGPYSCVTLTAAVYAGQLLVDFHYDPRVLNPFQAEELKSFFVQAVCESAGLRADAPARTTSETT